MKEASWVDVLALFVSLCAFALAYLNHQKYKTLQTESNDLQRKSNELQGQYNAMVEMQTLTGAASLELQLRSVIQTALSQIQDLAVEVAKSPKDKTIKKAYLSAEEGLRNAYEDACAKYIDGKIDKERFKNLYLIEIRKLVEEKPHDKFYSGNQSPYTCTLAVYKEWYRQA